MKTNKLTAISYSNRSTDRQIDKESVIIYLRGGGGGGGGVLGGNGVLGERRGEQSSLTEFKEGSIKVYR